MSDKPATFVGTAATVTVVAIIAVCLTWGAVQCSEMDHEYQMEELRLQGDSDE